MPGLPLTLLDREEIGSMLLLWPGVSWAELGRRVDRHPTTVAREVIGHGGRLGYRQAVAHAAAVVALKRQRVCKLAVPGLLRDRVTVSPRSWTMGPQRALIIHDLCDINPRSHPHHHPADLPDRPRRRQPLHDPQSRPGRERHRPHRWRHAHLRPTNPHGRGPDRPDLPAATSHRNRNRARSPGHTVSTKVTM